MANIYDGTFATVPVQDGAKKVILPLATLGGYDAQVIERNMVCAASAFASIVSARYTYTVASALVTTPTTDPENSAAFLVEESAPDEGQLAIGIARFRRVYATVPTTLVLPSTFVVSRPQIPGNGTFPRQYSDYIIDQPDTTVEAFDIYDRNTVTSDSGVPSFYPTAGSYSLVFAGYTTSTLAFNASSATVESALDALASVVSRGGVGVTGSYNSAGGFAVTFANYATGSIDDSGVGVSTDGTKTVVTSSSNGGYSQSFSIIANNGTHALGSGNGSGLTISGGVMQDLEYSFANGYIQDYYFTIGGGGSITGGTFTVSLLGGTSSAIAYNATEAQIQTALNAISEVVAASGVTVSDYHAYSYEIYFRVTFSNAKIRSGSYTVSLFSQTSATIAYNAVTASISSAINALSSVVDRGDAVISGLGLNTDDTRIDFSVNFSNEAIEDNATQLSPNTTITESVTNSGRTQSIKFLSDSALRTIYATDHNAVANSKIFVYASPSYYTGITNYTVIDPNTIQLAPRASDTWASVLTITQAGGIMKENYTPGPKRVRCTKRTNFYLPGYTTGITTSADIPIPSEQSSDADLLAAIFGAEPSINISVTELEPYRYPILQTTVVTVSAADL